MAILRFFFFCSLLSILSVAQGQERLSETDFAGDSVYVYRLNGADLYRIYQQEKQPDESCLHTLITCYSAKSEVPDLPRGNYMLVQAQKNRLRYDSHTVDDLNYYLLQSSDLLLYLSDSIGQPIAEANVKLGRRSMRYDVDNRLYKSRNFRKERLLEIENRGVYHYVLLKPRDVIYHSPKKKSSKNRSEELFSSFLVFSKPKYRPKEEVMFKAFLQSEKGELFNEAVEVRLKGPRIDSLLTILLPYRPGFYEYKFDLSDELKLNLDRFYSICLYRVNAKKRMLLENSFRYEDYELKGFHFSCKANIHTHHRQNSPAISVEITDENEMAVLEGSCRMTVRPKGGHTYIQAQGFVPDLLWETSFDWTGNRKKEVQLPDSIFPQGVSFDYVVNCIYQTPDQERYERNLHLRYEGGESMIRFTSTNDGILVEQITNGRVDTATAQINGFDRQHKLISAKKVELPFLQRWGEHILLYAVKSDKASGSYRRPPEAPLSCQLRKENDSIRIIIQNPHGYPCWYRLLRNEKVIEEGTVKQLNKVRRVKEKGNYCLRIDYLFGGEIRHLNREVLVPEKSIDIRLHTPELVSPGQTTRMELELSDYRGEPVVNADVTAYGFTSKFGSLPHISPFHWEVPLKQELNIAFSSHAKKSHYQGKMDWERWRKEMNLEKRLAYQFMFPDPLFRVEEPAWENITQLAPFAFIDGEMQTVYWMELDGLPYYYYQSEHLNGYSFPVATGKHDLTLHLYDRRVKLQEFEVRGGMKNIISIDVTESVPEMGLFVEQRPEEEREHWSESERRILNQYLFRVWDNFAYKRSTGLDVYIRNAAYLYADPFLFLLDGQRFRTTSSNIRRKSWLVGPFPDWQPISLYVGEEKVHEFPVEGGNQYIIRKNYLKLKETDLLPDTRSKAAPKFDLKSFVLSPKKIQREQEEDMRRYIKQQHKVWTISEDADSSAMVSIDDYRLTLQLKNEEDAAAHYLTLFYYADQNRWQIYSGGVRFFNQLLSANPKMILVFDQNRYFECQLDLKSGGVNFQLFDSIEMQSQPMAFTRWLEQCIRTKIIGMEDERKIDFEPRMDSVELRAGEYPITIQVCDALLGEPLSGCSVRVKGRTGRKSTDEQGRVELSAFLGEEIVCSSLGFKEKRIKVIREGSYYLFLEQDQLIIERGVVSSAARYGGEEMELFMMKRNDLEGVKTEGANSDLADFDREGDKETLATLWERVSMVLLNGVPYSGSLEEIDESTILTSEVIPTDKAVELFGEQARNGILVLTTADREKEDGSVKTLRINFRDDAFWEPTLRTNEDGKVAFDVTWPDDITSWNVHFLAVGDKSRFGQLTKSIKSFKSLSARLSCPRFLIEEDSTHLIGKMNNYLGDSLNIMQQFVVNGKSHKQTYSFTTSHVDTLPIKAVGRDSIHLQYSMHAEGGFFDGEEREIPVLRRGVKESHGLFQLLQTDSLYRFQLDTTLGEVTIYAETAPLEFLLREIEEIELYAHACNEQIAAQLKTLLLKKQVAQFMGKPFKEEKKIKKWITKLTDSQNAEGLWGWWGRQATEEWISMQVLEALLAAERAGYRVKWNRQLFVQGVIRQLHAVIANLEDFPEERLKCLKRLAMLKALNEPFDYIASYHKIAKGKWQTDHEKLWAFRVKQLIGLPIAVEEILHSAQKTLLGGLYWEDKTEKVYLPHNNQIQNTLLAYQLLHDAGGYERELQQIRGYLFEMRREGHWNNIYDASRIIEVVLSEELFGQQPFDSVQMVVNGEEVKSFPFKKTVDPEESLEIQKWGKLPIYFTAYQESWNEKPLAQSNGFQVQTYFRKELKQTNEYTTPREERVQELKAGEPVELVVQVRAGSEAHYVLLNIPIPAGCSYESKSQSWWRDAHREYHQEKVSVFCRRMPGGDKNPIVFTVKLIPRFSGKYHLNPASVELLYFPTLNGRTEIKQIPIQ